GPCLHPGPPGVRLKASPAATATPPPSVFHHHVPNLACGPPAVPELPFQDEPAAHPCPDEHAKQVPVWSTGPPLELAQDGDPNVVVQDDRDPAGQLRDLAAQVHGALKSRDIGGERDNSRFGINLAWRADPDRREVTWAGHRLGQRS